MNNYVKNVIVCQGIITTETYGISMINQTDRLGAKLIILTISDWLKNLCSYTFAMIRVYLKE
jgi:hypothetical protein